MHRGYIKIWRKIEDWDWFKDSNTVALFIHLLLKCNHKPTNYFGYIIDRGSCVCGRKQLSLSTGISEQSIRTSLTKLKSTNDLTIKSTNKFSIISITNYELYQAEPTNKTTNKSTFNQPTTNQQLTTSKECKNDKNEKNNTITMEDKVKKVMEVWNANMKWKIEGIQSTRLKHLKERLKEPKFVERFGDILDTIKATPFLMGEKNNPKHPNFRADFDWIICNGTNYLKILEGKYGTGAGEFEA